MTGSAEFIETLKPLMRSSLFWQADRVAEPPNWVEHVPFAFWIVDVLKPKRIVELGTHSGTSYSAMCQAVSKLKLDTKCYAIDTWMGDEHAGQYSDEVYNEFAKYHDLKFSSFSKMIRSTFEEALPLFEDSSIDLLHIDGLHTYDAVRNDFESWFPKLSKNAVVMFHDTNVRERDFGVFRLWSELQGKYRNFEFLHCHGLGVLGLGQNYDAPLEFLFQKHDDPTAVSSIRNVFATLGASTHSALLKAKAERLQFALNERNERIAAMERSASWRYTKHMRSVEKRLKSLKSRK